MLGNKFLLAEEVLIFALKNLNVSQEPLDGDRKLLNPPYSLTSQGKENERKKENFYCTGEIWGRHFEGFHFLTKNSTSPKKACAFLKTWVPANTKALFPFP